MKKNFKIAIILSLVCAVCAALIAFVNMITRDSIEQNKIDKQNAALNELYEGATFNEVSISDNNITKLFEVYNKETLIGYIYNVEGKNSYGSIEIMIGINVDKKIKDIVVFNNTQSYKQIVNDHIESNYAPGITEEEVNSIDVYCGATKGAKLTKELVQIAFDHFDSLVGDTNE